MHTKRNALFIASAILMGAALHAQTGTPPAPTPPAPAANPSSPLPRESQLEFQLIDAKAKEVAEKIQALYDLLMNPIITARSAAVVRACNLVGLAPLDGSGKPVCQVKDGMVVRLDSGSK